MNKFTCGELVQLRKGGYEIHEEEGVRYNFSQPLSDVWVRHGDIILVGEYYNDTYFWGTNTLTGERGVVDSRHFKKVRKK